MPRVSRARSCSRLVRPVMSLALDIPLTVGYAKVTRDCQPYRVRVTLL